MAKRIDDDVLEVLARATCEDGVVRLNAPTLERKLYERTDKVLRALGGQWHRGKGGHLFPDVEPAPLLEEVLSTGEHPPANPFAFFATPRALALRAVLAAGTVLLDRLLAADGELDVDDLELLLGLAEEMEPEEDARRHAEIAACLAALDQPGVQILEPHGGDGALAEVIREVAPRARLDVVEIDRVRAAVLRRKGFQVAETDFLALGLDGYYDAVIGNPPFALSSDRLAYIPHTMAMYRAAQVGGAVVSINPAGFITREDRRCREYRAFVEAHGAWEALPGDTFRESGTGVAAALVTLTRAASDG